MALVLGAVLGVVARATSGSASWLSTSSVRHLADRPGLLSFSPSLPLVLSRRSRWVCEIARRERARRVGLRTAVFTVAVSAVSVVIGLVLVNLFEPGAGFGGRTRATDRDVVATAGGVLEQAKHSLSPIDASCRSSRATRSPPSCMPRRRCSASFFALLVGVALATTPRERTAGLVATLEGVYAISLHHRAGHGDGTARRLRPALLAHGPARRRSAVDARAPRRLLIGLTLPAEHVFRAGTRDRRHLAARLPSPTGSVMITAFSTSSSAAALRPRCA